MPAAIVITCHVDGPKVVIQTAEKPRREELRPQRQPGVRWRPKGFVTGAEYKWGTIYTQLRQDELAAGEALPNWVTFGGYRQGHDPEQRRTGPAADRKDPQGRRRRRSRISRPSKPIYAKPVKDNKAGTVVILPAAPYDNYDPYALTFHGPTCVDGVLGSIT